MGALSIYSSLCSSGQLSDGEPSDVYFLVVNDVSREPGDVYFFVLMLDGRC